MKSFKLFLFENAYNSKKIEDIVLYNFFGNKKRNYKTKRSKKAFNDSPRTWFDIVHVLKVPKQEVINTLNAYPEVERESSVYWQTTSAKAYRQKGSIEKVEKMSGNTIDLKIVVPWDDDFYENIARVKIGNDETIAYIKDFDTKK